MYPGVLAQLSNEIEKCADYRYGGHDIRQVCVFLQRHARPAMQALAMAGQIRYYLLGAVAALLISAAPCARSDCKDWMARLVALQGSVEWQASGTTPWQKAVLDLAFCKGNRIRTLNQSRATLQLRNETFVPMGQMTTVSRQ